MLELPPPHERKESSRFDPEKVAQAARWTRLLFRFIVGREGTVHAVLEDILRDSEQEIPPIVASRIWVLADRCGQFGDEFHRELRREFGNDPAFWDQVDRVLYEDK